MECSCPDWAVPCKHLAAVIYMIANEIDLNPFKVLELHGLDVLHELAGQDTGIESIASEKIESWDDYFTNSPPEYDSPVTTGMEEPDFSYIPDTGEVFLNLLSPNPPFFEKDFKTELLAQFKYIQKNIKTHFTDDKVPNLKYDIQNCINASVIYIEKGYLLRVELVFEHDTKRISIIDLFQIFNIQDQFAISQFCESLKVIYWHFLFAKKIIEQGAVIPQLVIFNNCYRIFWIPLLQDDSVKLQIEILNKNFSSVNIVNENHKKLSYFSNPEHFSMLLSSVIVTKIIQDIVFWSRKDINQDTVSKLFFGTPCPIEKITKDRINAVQLWLHKIHSHIRTYIPVLEVTENYPDFFISLLIKINSKDKIEAAVPFHQFRQNNKDKMISVIKI